MSLSEVSTPVAVRKLSPETWQAGFDPLIGGDDMERVHAAVVLPFTIHGEVAQCYVVELVPLLIQAQDILADCDVHHRPPPCPFLPSPPRSRGRKTVAAGGTVGNKDHASFVWPPRGTVRTHQPQPPRRVRRKSHGRTPPDRHGDLVRKRVLMGTTTAPSLAGAKNVYSHSGRLGIQGATWSPGRIPRPMKALAVSSMSA